jgi:hypothetical protein
MIGSMQAEQQILTARCAFQNEITVFAVRYDSPWWNMLNWNRKWIAKRVTTYICWPSVCTQRGMGVYKSESEPQIMQQTLEVKTQPYYTGCPPTYWTRHFFNNSNTNEDIATKQTHSSSFLTQKTYWCSKLVAISSLVLERKSVRLLSVRLASG